MTVNPETGGSVQDRCTKFKPGLSGNPKGRPRGSRNKLGEDFVAALQANFAEHGASTIEEVRVNKPDVYLRVIASILPREIKVSSEADLSDDELNQRIRHLAASLELAMGGEAGISAAPGGEAEAVRSDAAGPLSPVH